MVAIYRISKALEAFVPQKINPELARKDIDVPDDLVALAMQENASWAQEEVLRVIRERYEELSDWNRVRAAMGIGRID